MSVTIEALYIYDEQKNVILEHVYTSRPLSAQSLLSRFYGHPAPRPSILRLPNTLPPTSVFSLSIPNLLLLCPCSSDVNVLAVIEFLHRVVDVFEDFLGAPLLPSKIESNYDVVAQLLVDMCDGGVVVNTEGNALRENVEVSDRIGKLFAQVGLAGSSPALGPINSFASTLKATPNLNTGPAIPWRRSNVRHISNELYVDMLETLSVILAPSGRPLSAIATGSIAFTAKISGVPDLLLTLTAPGGTSHAKSSSLARTMQLPIFHPCIRLARWKEHPGEFSFVPPDGRFMLAGYEVDLLPSSLNQDHPPTQCEKLFLPAQVELRTGLGSSGCDFEARLTLDNKFPGTTANSSGARPVPGPFSFGNSSGGSAPTLEGVSVTIPFPEAVRSVTELKMSRGEAHYSPWDRSLEWKVPTKDGTTISGVATLTGTIAGPPGLDDSEQDGKALANKAALLPYYDEDLAGSVARDHAGPDGDLTSAATPQKRLQAHQALMPKSATVSFTVKGWLPSGIRVDSLVIDMKKSKGLGDGVRPIKGVKYMTVSRRGVERRI